MPAIFLIFNVISRILQLIEWTPEGIQEYCQHLTHDPITQLKDSGYYIEDEEYRGHHLFGIYLRKGQSPEGMKQKLLDHGIYVSYRGNSIRVSPNVYNSPHEVEKLVSCFI
ncbi:MAG: aminotransferase, partial [Bacteroidota bacterium]